MPKGKIGLAFRGLIVYIIYTMSFIRKIRKNGKTYLAEVENRWVEGKCVQKHIRYIGKEADGRTILSSSLSDVVVDEVKLYGPLLVLNHLAHKIDLPLMLGPRASEVLSLVYAHCLDYKSVNQMERWFQRTDLSLLLNLEGVTEQALLDSLDTLESIDATEVQRQIFKRVVEVYGIPLTGVIYDVTNTYLYGKRCGLAKLGHDKEGVKGRPLIQVGLAVTKDSGIPVCHKVLDGNIHDARMFQDFVTDLRPFKIHRGLVIYDRGIASSENIRQTQAIGWETLCGLPIRGQLAQTVREMAERNQFVQLENRVRLRKNIFYGVVIEHRMGETPGWLAICYNQPQQRELRESRYDEIEQARDLLVQGRAHKAGMEKYFTAGGRLRKNVLAEAEEFDGYFCLFSTTLLPLDQMVRLYFDKDLVEKAFRTLKGVTRLRPIRHWLYNRVTAHVFICYLAYLLLSLLQYKLQKHEITAEEALLELDSMYKVYLRDDKKGFKVSRVVTLTKKQEAILKAVDRKILKF